MLRNLCFAAAACATAVCSFAASVPSRGIRGKYVEARTADVYTGACFANGEVGQVGQFAVCGWTVDAGSWHGVPLDGLSVVGVIRASHTLGDIYESVYPVKGVIIVDSRAGGAQRLALQDFARYMAGDLLQDVVRVDTAPIELKVRGNNVHTAAATLTAGRLARIETRPLNDGDKICFHEDVYYPPLTRLDHAMPAYTLAHTFDGQGLHATWSSPDRRSAFVGTFSATSE